MKIFNNILRLLNKPFPREETWSAFLKTVLAISAFVTIFLYLFEPFGLSTVESKLFLACLGFGASTFIGCVVYELVMTYLLRLKGRREQFVFWKWALYVMGFMLCISVANFLYARIYFFGYIEWSLLPDMVRGTFMVGIFPTLALGALTLWKQERKYQHIAAEINEKKAHPTKSGVFAETTALGIPASQIRYVEALQNYVRIGFIGNTGQLEEKVERATLKSILDEMGEGPIVRCHRSFLVNQNAVVSASGNAQGLLLSLEGCDKTIPVSRSFVAGFRD